MAEHVTAEQYLWMVRNKRPADSAARAVDRVEANTRFAFQDLLDDYASDRRRLDAVVAAWPRVCRAMPRDGARAIGIQGRTLIVEVDRAVVARVQGRLDRALERALYESRVWTGPVAWEAA